MHSFVIATYVVGMQKRFVRHERSWKIIAQIDRWINGSMLLHITYLSFFTNLFYLRYLKYHVKCTLYSLHNMYAKMMSCHPIYFVKSNRYHSKLLRLVHSKHRNNLKWYSLGMSLKFFCFLHMYKAILIRTNWMKSDNLFTIRQIPSISSGFLGPKLNLLFYITYADPKYPMRQDPKSQSHIFWTCSLIVCTPFANTRVVVSAQSEGHSNQCVS